MSGAVTARPWKKPGQFMVYIPLKWPDGSKTSDRRVIARRTERAALEWGERRKAVLLAQGPEAARPKQQEPKVPTLSDNAAEWIRVLRGNPKKKPQAIDSIESMLRIHLLPFIGILRLNEITEEVVDALASRWTTGGYEYVGQHGHVRIAKGTRCEKTHANRKTVLRSCLMHAVRYGRIAAMPAKIEIRHVRSGEAAHYDHEVYEQLVAASAVLGPRPHAALLLGGDAGLRRNEIIAILEADVDWKRGRVVVRRSAYWKKKVCTDNTPKGGTEEPVPCTPRLFAALCAVRHDRGGRLLQTDEGKPLTPPMLRRWIMQAEEKAGLPRTGRVHIYRHTFCSRLAAAGVPARVIQQLARHKDLSTTQRYMHLSPNAKYEGIEMLEESRLQGGAPVNHSRLVQTRVQP